MGGAYAQSVFALHVLLLAINFEIDFETVLSPVVSEDDEDEQFELEDPSETNFVCFPSFDGDSWRGFIVETELQPLFFWGDCNFVVLLPL